MNEVRARAAAGDAEAMFWLGQSLLHGSGLVQEYAAALLWFGRAAAKGYCEAVYQLGHMHEHGLGTPVDLRGALGYYKQAKRMGYDYSDLVDVLMFGDPIARVEAAIAAAGPGRRPALGPHPRHAQEQARVLRERQQDAAQKQREAEREAAITKREADLKKMQQQQAADAERMRTQQQALDAERARLQQKDAELLQREAAVGEREQALNALNDLNRMISTILRDSKAERDAKKAGAAALATAKQAEVLAARRTEGSAYAPARAAVIAAWNPTKVDLASCPVHARPLALGQSVLLGACLHAICRECAPHMLQPDNSVRCPVCQAVSTVDPTALPHHPLIEAPLAAGTSYDCAMCQTAPDDERVPATLKCAGCSPAKLLCEGHAVNHRIRMPGHAIAPLPHGGAALRCATHDKPVEAYCTGCRTLICLACTLTTHQAHAARLLTDAAFVADVRARLVDGAAQARAVAAALVDHAADATVAVAEADARDAAIGSEIDRAMNVLAGRLDRSREAAHAQGLLISREERAAFQKAREESEHRWRIVMSAADVAEQLAAGTQLGVNATAVMVQLEAAATERLGAVLQLKPERGVPPPSHLRFDVDESRAEELIAEVGDVVQDAPPGLAVMM